MNAGNGNLTNKLKISFLQSKCKPALKKKLCMVAMTWMILPGLFIPGTSLAQNLIPNGGFEEIVKETEGHAFMENVDHWYNTNQNRNSALFGTPDHMFDTGNKEFQKYRTSFKPYKGRSCAGVITYMQRVNNYREYLSVKLTEPLKTGKKYKFTMYVSSGDRRAFGNIGTNGFGVCLTSYPLKQWIYEPLGIEVQAQFMFQEIFYDLNWQKIEFTFEAESSLEYLTLGNFLNDYQTHIRYYSYDVDPQGYVFIDEVSLVEVNPNQKEPEPEAKISEPVASAEPVLPTANNDLQGRYVNQQGLFRVEGDEIEVRLWDQRRVDGDMISLKFNGEWVVREYTLKKRKKTIHLKFDPDKENELILFAHNLGDEPPNTAALIIMSGNKVRRMSLRADLNYCGSIQFVQ
ncbi:hypothetical protein AAG747_01140 [Rapidithrix thailandica]|uniref:Uncharacterized protein n=1 Tax=Rapidithrix thailandica TaxID=413964 RepID=A0AAW9S6A6_9BACT